MAPACMPLRPQNQAKANMLHPASGGVTAAIQNRQYAYRPDAPRYASVGDPEQQTEKKPRPAEDAPDAVLCRHCFHLLTYQRERIFLNGRHTHTFANPHGIVFEIACFRRTPGVGTTGLPSDEFTWFQGYAWQIALCGGCLVHVGWRFTSPDASFSGLILDRLMMPPPTHG